MNERKQKKDYRPTKDEIKAMSHYWAAAVADIRAARNRKERREAVKNAKKR